MLCALHLNQCKLCISQTVLVYKAHFKISTESATPVLNHCQEDDSQNKHPSSKKRGKTLLIIQLQKHVRGKTLRLLSTDDYNVSGCQIVIPSLQILTPVMTISSYHPIIVGLHILWFTPMHLEWFKPIHKVVSSHED